MIELQLDRTNSLGTTGLNRRYSYDSTGQVKIPHFDRHISCAFWIAFSRCRTRSGFQAFKEFNDSMHQSKRIITHLHAVYMGLLVKNSDR